MSIPTYRPDADLENADWTKQSWDFPPYGSPAFLNLIGGPDALPKFRKSSAYLGAVDAGLIHDDEWVADWVQPVTPPHNEPTPGTRRNVHVHIHRRPT